MELASLEDLSVNINYDPATGALVWKCDQAARVHAGDLCGYLNEDGYRAVTFRRRRYRAARIAWLLTHGRWPEDEIDHINGNPADDRLCNLREATKRQNLLNRRRRSSAPGLKGVSPGRGGKFRAVIRLDGKQRHLGEFATPEAAHAAYVDAAKELHGEFANFS